MSSAKTFAMSKDDDTPANNYRDLLKDPDVKGWYEEMLLANPVRADDYLRRLFRYCRAIGMSPAQIVARAKDQDGGRRAVEQRYTQFATLMRNPHKPVDHKQPDDVQGVKPEICATGHPASYVGNYGKALRSYLAYQGMALRRIKVGDTDAAPTLEGVPPPTKDHVRRAIKAADDRGKVVIAFRAWTGVRPEVLGRPDASDGLVLQDLPELRIKDGIVTFDKMPNQVVVRQKLSKIHRPETKFLPAEGCRYLKAYLERRAAHGEELGPDSAIVSSDRYRSRRFLEEQAIAGIVRKAFRAIGLPNRPYDLRNFFIAGLESAEHEGMIGHVKKEFFIGRKREIDLVYTHGRYVSPEALEELREEYRRCEPYLGARPEPAAAAAEMPPVDYHELAKAMLEEDYARLKEKTGLDAFPKPAWSAEVRRIQELENQVQDLRARVEANGATVSTSRSASRRRSGASSGRAARRRMPGASLA